MFRITFAIAELEKHGISTRESLEVMARITTKEFYDLPDSRRGKRRVMLVGFTDNGRLLEIGIEQLPDGSDHVFHARKSTREYERKYHASR